jgi:hypothetical protein
MTSKDPFTTEGVSVYGKTGITVQNAAGANEYMDVGVRFAKKFSDKLAIKANITYLQGAGLACEQHSGYESNRTSL